MYTSKIFFTGLICFIAFACDKSEFITMKGNAVGFVKVISESGGEITDKSGIKVIINDGLHSVLTDANGRYEFMNLGTGTYNLRFEKEGFGTYKIFSWQFVGGNLPALVHETTMYQLPSFDIKTMDAVIDPVSKDITLRGTFTKDAESYSMRCFIKKTPDVSNTNHDYAGTTYNFFLMPHSEYYYSTNINDRDSEFKKGDKLYLAMYLYNIYAKYSDYYYDPEIDTYVHYYGKQAFKTIELVYQ